MFSSAFVRICGCGRKGVVHGISVCMVLCALCVSAATVTWTGRRIRCFPMSTIGRTAENRQTQEIMSLSTAKELNRWLSLKAMNLIAKGFILHIL